MRLQSDPTIVYGLVGGKGSLGHSISRAELDKFTPYNTYAIEGLPPGPIANPGRAALEAVANPSRTQDLYFVADGTGGHVFAATLDEHVRNVQRWRQIEKDTKDKIAPDLDKTVAPAAALKPGQESEFDQGSPSQWSLWRFARFDGFAWRFELCRSAIACDDAGRRRDHAAGAFPAATATATGPAPAQTQPAQPANAPKTMARVRKSR